MGFQVAFEIENVFAQSMSAGRVPGGWSSNRKSAFDGPLGQHGLD